MVYHFENNNNDEDVEVYNLYSILSFLSTIQCKKWKYIFRIKYHTYIHMLYILHYPFKVSTFLFLSLQGFYILIICNVQEL